MTVDSKYGVKETSEQMTFIQIIKRLIKKADKYSPYPVLYQFVMTKNEQALFDRAVNKSQNYLEFGLGGSTIRAIQNSKATIFSVESCVDWIAHMRRYMILRYFENKRLFIFPVDIGPTREWGYPASDSDKHLFGSYSSNVFESIDAANLDLALVDGRFRVACTLKLVLECSENSNFQILIHDFFTRDHYHTALKYLDVIDRADTLGLFSIKKNIDLRSVEEDYEVYKVNPA